MNRHKTIWTDEKDARLRALWNEGVTGSQIAERMGMTKNAVIGRVHRLKLQPRVSPLSTITRPWTDEEDARLAQLYGGILNLDQIGQKLDRSPASIRYRATHLGLVSKKGSAEHRARLSGARKLSPPPGPRATRASAAPPSAPGTRVSGVSPACASPGVAPETLQQRRVFLGRQCKMVLSGDDEPLRFCDQPVIASARGQNCASPYCLAHYAAAYIGTNKDLGNPGPARWA